MKTLLVALALSVALPAWAQSEMKSELPASTPDRPWAKGVSPEAQKAADELFRQGNDLLRESLFVQAATKYREALRRWDHPGIHYNLALALLNLDQTGRGVRRARGGDEVRRRAARRRQVRARQALPRAHRAAAGARHHHLRDARAPA